jgi:cytoskeleton protein RodZ
MHLELTASEPTWVSMMAPDRTGLFARLLVPGHPRSVDVEHAATLRTGNAGGLQVALDGKPLGPIGPKGKVREIEFKDGVFKITSPD